MEKEVRIKASITQLIPFFLLLPLLTLVFVLLFGSVIYVLASSSHSIAVSMLEVLPSSYFISAYITTLKVGLMVVLLSAILSYPLAVYGRFVNFKVERLLSVVVFIPLMINPLIRAFGWMIILGREGVLNSILMYFHIITHPLSILYTENAVVLGLLELFFPFMYLSLYSSLENIPEEYILAAQSLGAGTLRVFLDIILPLSITGLATGASIIMAGCAAAFVTPSILGGLKVKTLSVLLREYVDIFLDWNVATVIALVILATTLLIIGVINLVKKLVMRW